MKVLRSILSDLVEKRLWPVAVALLAALVAVPLLLSGGSEPAADTPIAAAPAKPAAVTGQVVALEDPTAKVSRDGAVRDPFVQHHVPKADEQPAVETPAATQPQAADESEATSAPSTDTSSTPSTTTEQPAEEPAEKKLNTDTYRVKLTVETGEDTKELKDVARLVPLPSADEPFFVFMGVQEDGETATFLIASDATVTPNDTCKPSKESCETVSLAVDDTAFFDVTLDDGTVVQYELTLDKVVKGKAKTEAKAKAARARESAAGRETLRRLKKLDPKLLQGWSYSADLGVLVAEQAPEGAKVSGPKSSGLAAAAQR